MSINPSPVNPPRPLCSLGTGEVVHIFSFTAADGSPPGLAAFEAAVQTISRDLYSLTTNITDVRIAHPRCGRVCFVLTFTGERELMAFRAGPEKDIRRGMAGLCVSNWK